MLAEQRAERLKRWAAAFAVAMSVLPFLLVDHLPLIDLPNHIARLIVREDLRAGGPLSAFYEWRWVVIPNLAIDLLSVPFVGWVDAETFVNVVAILSVIGVYGGAIAIDRTLNGARWGISLLTGLIVFHGALRYGFINYVVSLAFAVPLFAAWLRCRHRLGVGTVLGFILAGVFVMLMHMFAFGLYAICVAGYELALLLRERPWRIGPLRRRLPLLGVAVTLLAPASLVLMGPVSGAVGATIWSNVRWKLEALVAPVFFSQPWVELPLLAVMGLVIAVGLLAGVVRLHRDMVPVLVLLTLVFLAMPRMLFGSHFADYRLLCGAAFFVIGSLRFTPRSDLVQWAGVTLGVLLLTLRIASIAVEWRAAQTVLHELDAALDDVPAGSRLLVLRSRPESASRDRAVPTEHAAVLAAAKRRIFVGNNFAAHAQPLQLKPAFKDFYHDLTLLPAPLPLSRYDYLLAIGHPEIPQTPGHQPTLVTSSSSFRLYRVQ